VGLEVGVLVGVIIVGGKVDSGSNFPGVGDIVGLPDRPFGQIHACPTTNLRSSPPIGNTEYPGQLLLLRAS
jgi:hypothetical protein